jgi:hypothetical protein
VNSSGSLSAGSFVDVDDSALTHLICAECDAEADPEARGWRAYLDCEDNVVTFCPERAEREFD